MITTLIIMGVLIIILFLLVFSLIGDIVQLKEDNALLRFEYENFANQTMVSEMGIDKILKGEKELEESKSKNKVLQSGERLLTSINEYKERDASSGKYKKGKLIYAVMKTLINTKAELSAKELAEKLGTSTACVRKSLNHLIETRDVERKRYGKLYKYRLADWVSIEYS